MHKQPFHTFTLVLWWQTSQWNSWRYLLVNRSKCSPVNHWISPKLPHKTPHLQKTTNPTCSSQPLPGKWLLPPISCTATATCICPDTTEITPEGSAKHLWNAPQGTHHGNKIWKSWHRGFPCHQSISSPGSYTTRTPYARRRQWIIWWILWRNWHSPPLSWISIVQKSV